MASPSERWGERIKAGETRLEEARRGGPPTIDGGDGGPHDPGMEARVAKLEESIGGIDKALREIVPTIQGIAVELPKIRSDMADLKGKVIGVEGRLTGIEGRLTGIDGRLTGIEGQLRQVPTIWTFATLVISIFGLAFVLLKFAAPH